MATHFFIKALPDGLNGKVFARVRSVSPRLDMKLSTRLVVPLAVWEKFLSTCDKEPIIEYDCGELSTLERLRCELNQLLSQDGQTEENLCSGIKQTLRRIVSGSGKSLSGRAWMQDNSFMEYYARFLYEAQQGRAKNIGLEKGKQLARRTIINYQQGYKWLREFQADELGGRGIGFSGLDKTFFDRYIHYLCSRTITQGPNKGARGCSQNTIALRITEIKSILRRAAEEDGVSGNSIYLSKNIRIKDVEVDDVVLSREELDALQEVDLSGFPCRFEWARDLFMVGVWTAQRVSDYNNISRDDIKHYKRSVEVSDSAGVRHCSYIEGNYICIRQKKTGKTVSVPVNSQLQAILDKYGNKLPHLWGQKINRYIKVIARRAGITEKVRVTSVRGGRTEHAYIEKCELIHSHTARKTGATLMFNEGVDIYDIMAITGHSSVNMLKKYVKADSGETAGRIAAKYAYFK